MFKDIKFSSERTDAGYRITATGEVDPRYMQGVRLWAQREAEAGRLFAVTNLAD